MKKDQINEIKLKIKLIENIIGWMDECIDTFKGNNAEEFIKQVRPLLDPNSEINRQIHEIHSWLLLNRPDMAKEVENQYKRLKKTALSILMRLGNTNLTKYI